MTLGNYAGFNIISCEHYSHRKRSIKMTAKDTQDTTKVSLSQAFLLRDSISYQDGAIVSREIVGKKTGTVTVFAFDEGQGLSEHIAPFDALVYILDGEAEIHISGKPHRVKESEMIIMPAHEPHALKAMKRFKMLLIMIRA
jgi:quercetin dioxygenase-like cupin family protein